jgi:hypothetical protein
VPVEEGSWPRLSAQTWAEYLEDIQLRPVAALDPTAGNTWTLHVQDRHADDDAPRPVVAIDPGLRDGSGITYVQVETHLASMLEAFRCLAAPARQAEAALAQASDAVQDAIRLRPGGFLPGPLVRSPLGAGEDPHAWTMPAGDQMHWTAPETDEEVPRWLA